LKQLNKEQILFILCLMILGGLAYLRFDDQYNSKSVRNTRNSMDLEENPLYADIQFVDSSMGFFTREGRNIYAPPRDWLPLEPLVLDTPPYVELMAVAPFSRPGLGASFFKSYHYLPVPASPLSVDGEGEEDTELMKAEDFAMGDSETEGVAINLDSIEDIEENPEAALLAIYDWIKLNDQGARIFGYIKNDNKYDLLKNDEPIKFEMVAVKSGRVMAPHDYQRERVGEFGFADTVVNRIELAILDINFNAGNLTTIHEKADWCISMADEEQKAIGYAVNLLERAIDLDPLSKESYNRLVDVHTMNHDRESALNVIQSALERKLNSAAIHVRYGRLLRWYKMDDKALDAFMQAEYIKPKFADSLVERAKLAYERRNYDESMRLFQEAVQSPSWDNDLKLKVIMGEGKCLLAFDRLPEALAKVQRVLKLDDMNSEAYNLKGTVLLNSGDIDGAQEAIEKAIELSENSSKYVVNLGVVLFRKGDFEGALQKFNEAIEMDPYNSSFPTAAKAFMSQCLGEEEAASSDYELAVEIDPTNFYALYLLGRDLIANGDMETAIDMLKKALRKNSKMADILSELGRACFLAGKSEDAAFYFEEYLNRDQGDFRIHYLLGLVLLNLNRIDDAITAFNKARSFTGEKSANPDPYNGIAYSKYAKGEVADSINAFGEVVRTFDEGSTDPRYLYAKRWMERIEDHRRKSQWLDGFQRKEIKNNWKFKQRCGPSISLFGNEITFQGIQRQEQPDERTSLRRSIEGREFRVFETDLCIKEENQARVGICIGTYIARGTTTVITKGEICLAVQPDGTLIYNVVDKGFNSVAWEKITHEPIQPGVPFRMGMELIDYERGVFRITLDGQPVLDGNLVVKDFRKNSREVLVGAFSEAPGSRKIAFTMDNARVVVKK